MYEYRFLFYRVIHTNNKLHRERHKIYLFLYVNLQIRTRIILF